MAKDTDTNKSWYAVDGDGKAIDVIKAKDKFDAWFKFDMILTPEEKLRWHESAYEVKEARVSDV